MKRESETNTSGISFESILIVMVFGVSIFYRYFVYEVQYSFNASSTVCLLSGSSCIRRWLWTIMLVITNEQNLEWSNFALVILINAFFFKNMRSLKLSNVKRLFQLKRVSYNNRHPIYQFKLNSKWTYMHKHFLILL